MEILVNGKNIEVNYSLEDNYHIIDLNDRPFNAIKNKTKTVEIRTNTPYIPFDFFKIKPLDKIQFVNNTSGETALVKVIRINKYDSVRELLEAEGTLNALSSGGNIEQGIVSVSNLTGYKESIPKSGILGIKVEVIEHN